MTSGGGRITLRDGSEVVVRPVRGTDKRLLAEGFRRLSAESVQRRFLVPQDHLTVGMLRYLTEIDHHDHEAIGAIDPRTGEGVGVARFIRDPERPSSAEVAVTVVDEWQGRGLGTLLLEVLAGRAREEGVDRFTAVLLADHREMLDLLEAELGPLRVLDRETGVVEVDAPVPDGPLDPRLRRVLRAVHPYRRRVASGG
jgi:GNAT superfamily N-acetyltransferase